LLGGAFLVACEPEEPQIQAPAGQSEQDDSLVAAQTVIDRTIEHIRQGNLQAAEANVQELERQRQNLPESFQKQVDTLQASLTAIRNQSVGQPVAPLAPVPQQ
jgi:hypothetical protein